jgi:hypothetical protein
VNIKNVSAIAKSVKSVLIQHGPEILTGFGIAGMVTTTILAVKETPKAMKLIEAEIAKKNREIVKEAAENGNECCEQISKLKPVETVKVAWKCYIPAALTGAVSVACLICANAEHLKRNAALLAAYKLSETALTEYRDKVIEVVGERKEEAVRDAVAKERVEKHPVEASPVFITGTGDTHCLDYWTDRYFKTDIDKIYKAENELNSQLLDEGYVNLNDFYYLLGLDTAGVGDVVGWSYNRTGLVKLKLSSILSSNKTPVMVIDFQTAPYYKYERY